MFNNKHQKNLFFSLPSGLILLLVFVLAIILVKLTFWTWMPEVFFGDDLSNLLVFKGGESTNTAWQILTTAAGEKYRPVFAELMWILFSLFDEKILPYLVLNIFLQGLGATLIFAITHRLSHGNWMVSLPITLAVATSRFALYQVTQVIGLLEGVAFIFFLTTFYCVVRAYEDKKSAWRWGWFAIAASVFAIHTHERYILLCVWLGFALTLMPSVRLLPYVQRLILLTASLAAFAFNILYKKWVLQIPFFVGTGGTHINLDVARTLVHLKQALLSIMGFNDGPAHLIGIKLIQLDWFPAWLFAAGFALALVIAITMGVRGGLRDKAKIPMPVWEVFYWPLILLVLGVFLLLPAISTIHLEQRWLLEPFVLLLFLFAWAAGECCSATNWRVWIFLSLIIGTCSIAIDAKIAPHFKNIFFVASGDFATAVKRDIVDQGLGQSGAIVFMTSQAHCNWTLLNGDFFRLYGGTRRTVYCFSDKNTLLTSNLPAETRVYEISSTSPLHMLDITSDYQNLLHK